VYTINTRYSDDQLKEFNGMFTLVVIVFEKLQFLHCSTMPVENKGNYNVCTLCQQLVKLAIEPLTWKENRSTNWLEWQVAVGRTNCRVLRTTVLPH